MSTLEGSITLQAFGVVYGFFLALLMLSQEFEKEKTGENINPFMSRVDSVQGLSG